MNFITYNLNDTYREKLCFTQFKNDCLAASDVFYMLTQVIKLYTFYYHVLKSTDV